MATYSDSELELLMSDLESDLVERKESAADGRKIRRNICAFANDLPGNGLRRSDLGGDSGRRFVRGIDNR